MNAELLIARKRKGVTQEALAKQAGISNWDVSRIENAGWLPPADVRQRIADALGLHVDEVFVPDRAAS